MDKYHVDLGLPAWYSPPTGDYPTIITHHARDRAEEKGIVIPTVIDFENYFVFEITVVNNTVSKFAIRGHYSDKWDICMAGVIDSKWKNRDRPKFVVFSAWLNHWQDRHKTLNSSAYSTV